MVLGSRMNQTRFLWGTGEGVRGGVEGGGGNRQAMMRGMEPCSCTVRPNEQVRKLSGEQVEKMARRTRCEGSRERGAVSTRA